MISPSEIEELAYKEQNGTINQQERDLLDLWYGHHDDTSFNYPYRRKKVKKRIWSNIKSVAGLNRSLRLWPKIISAACIILVAGIVLYLYIADNNTPKIVFSGQSKDIPAGGNHAILILENGSKIDLSQSNAKGLAMGAVPQIAELASKGLAYKRGTQKPSGQGERYNTIETPAGGQYQLTLADGSRIWLNSKSSLRFPVSFNGSEERVVELTGEGYFEIAKDARYPFIVQSRNQRIKVLGTHFNVNAYQDEPSVQTTLLEGSIQLQNRSDNVVLVPGEQAINDGKSIRTGKYQGTRSTSWKDGYFEFHNDDLRTVMMQIARWYDLTVVYTGELPTKRLTGKIYRNLPLSGALKVITYFNVSFEVADKTIYIK